MANLSNWEIMLMLIVILLVVALVSAVLCRQQNAYRAWCANFCDTYFGRRGGARTDASTPILAKGNGKGDASGKNNYEAMNDAMLSPPIPVIISHCSTQNLHEKIDGDDDKLSQDLLDVPAMQRCKSWVSIASIEGECDYRNVSGRLKRTVSALSIDPHAALVPYMPEPLPECVTAMVETSLCYDAPRGYLNVGIAYAYALHREDLKLFSECYVRLIIIPSVNPTTTPVRTQYRTTKVVKTAEVVEILQKFRFDLPRRNPSAVSTDRVELAKLQMEFNAYGRARSHTILGKREMILDSRTLVSGEPRVLMVNLYQPNLTDLYEPSSIGEVLVSLCYQPTSSKLTLILLQMKNLDLSLPKKTDRGADDLNAVCGSAYLVLDGMVAGRKKFKEVRVLDNVTDRLDLNQVVFFQVDKETLQSVELRIIIEAIDDDGTRTLAGFFYIGNSASGNGLLHWKYVTGNPRKPYVLWHSIEKFEQHEPGFQRYTTTQPSSMPVDLSKESSSSEQVKQSQLTQPLYISIPKSSSQTEHRRISPIVSQLSQISPLPPINDEYNFNN